MAGHEDGDRSAALVEPICRPLGEPEVRARLIGMVMSEDAWPFLQVWLEIVSRGGRGDLFYRDPGRAIAQDFINWIAAQSDTPDDAARTAVALRLLPILDGLILLRAVGLGEVCAAAWTKGPRRFRVSRLAGFAPRD